MSAVEQHADGAVWVDDPVVYVAPLDVPAATCTAEQARALAAELLEAAAVVERITG